MSTLLEIRDIKKKYGKTEALKGVSLDLKKGEIVSLLGCNGAGKTTLSSIIATLHPPTAGDIFMNGTSIYDDVAAYRRIMGYCPQKPNLNPLFTVRENLLFAGKYFGMNNHEAQQRVDTLVKQFKLREHQDKKPAELSGGFKQRVSIARSLMHNPQLVILDEPTVALDPNIRNQLWEYIKLLKSQGVTVLLTTHYLDEAEQLSDRVCLLDKGLVLLVDTPANLMTSFKKKRLEDVFLQLTEETNPEEAE